MMKRPLLTSVFVALPLVGHAADLVTTYQLPEEHFAPPPAHVGPTFLLEGYGGHNWIDSNDLNEVNGQGEADQYWLYGGWVGVSIPAMGDSGVQLEVFGEGTSAEKSIQEDNYIWSAGGGAHVYWRDPSRGLLGIMGGAFYSNTDTDQAAANEAWAWLAGVEGQVYLGMTTLYGHAGYTSYVNTQLSGGSQDRDYPKDTIFARGVARHFLGEYTKLEAEVGGAFGDFDGEGDSFYLVNWAVETEHAFTGAMPFSAFLRYEGIYAIENDPGSVGEDGDYSLDTTIKLGLRVRFGGAAQSPYFNDRHGVSLDLPDVGRWGGVLNGVIE